MVEHIERFFPDEYVVQGALSQALAQGRFSPEVGRFVSEGMADRTVQVIAGSMITLTTLAATLEDDEEFAGLVACVSVHAGSDGVRERGLRAQMLACCVDGMRGAVSDLPGDFNARIAAVREAVLS